MKNNLIKTEKISIRISPTDKKKLQEMAQNDRRSLADFIVMNLQVLTDAYKFGEKEFSEKEEKIKSISKELK